MTVALSILPLKEGSTGDAVYMVQDWLTAVKLYSGRVDGAFGAKTKEAVIKFQGIHNLTKDGIVGKVTAIALHDQAWGISQPVIKEGSTGDAVSQFQGMYNSYFGNITVDGVFGAKTKAEVIKFQKSRGLTPDGVVGAKTWISLHTLVTHDVPVDQQVDMIFSPGC